MYNVGGIVLTVDTVRDSVLYLRQVDFLLVSNLPCFLYLKLVVSASFDIYSVPLCSELISLSFLFFSGFILEYI